MLVHHRFPNITCRVTESSFSPKQIVKMFLGSIYQMFGQINIFHHVYLSRKIITNPGSITVKINVLSTFFYLSPNSVTVNIWGQFSCIWYPMEGDTFSVIFRFQGWNKLYP